MFLFRIRRNVLWVVSHLFLRCLFEARSSSFFRSLLKHFNLGCLKLLNFKHFLKVLCHFFHWILSLRNQLVLLFHCLLQLLVFMSQVFNLVKGSFQLSFSWSEFDKLWKSFFPWVLWKTLFYKAQLNLIQISIFVSKVLENCKS